MRTAALMEWHTKEPQNSLPARTVFKPAEAHARIAIFWARAAEDGFKPLLDHLEWQYFR